MATYKFNGPTNPATNNITGIISHYLDDGSPNIVSPGQEIELTEEKAAQLVEAGCDLEKGKSSGSSSSGSGSSGTKSDA